jgi:tripartite-type tricarboxylate transporter receptor subunit TctC
MRVVVALFALLFSQSGFAQNFPSKPITMVVGFEPGGGTDTVARVVAKFLSDNIGQQVLVENRAGAGGNIAVDYVIKSPPDGYTIVLANVGALTVNPHLMKLAYDPLRDLAPVTMAVIFPNIIVTNPKRMPAKTLAEFVKAAKEKPNTVTFGSSGVGGAGHLAGALLEEVAHIQLVHVPYKGGGPAMRGLLGGEVDCYISTPVAALPHIKSGKVLAIASTGAKRSTALPDVPTIAESGYPGYEAVNWYAYLAPAATPRPVIDYLNREIGKVLRAPGAATLLDRQGVDPEPTTPEALGAYMKREYETWGKVVKQKGIKAE